CCFQSVSRKGQTNTSTRDLELRRADRKQRYSSPRIHGEVGAKCGHTQRLTEEVAHRPLFCCSKNQRVQRPMKRVPCSAVRRLRRWAFNGLANASPVGKRIGGDRECRCENSAQACQMSKWYKLRQPYRTGENALVQPQEPQWRHPPRCRVISRGC